MRWRDHKDPEQCRQHTPLSRTHTERRPHLQHSAVVQLPYSSNPLPLEARYPVRQASYACGKTSRQKNLTAIHAAEAVSLDGVENMTEYLNEMCDEEMEKNMSDDEKEEREDGSGGRAVPPPYAELSSHFRALESIAGSVA